MRRRSLAVLLLVLGVVGVLGGITGLVLGRLGETTWAPDAEHVARVTLENPGPAVVIDPGILYAGGHEGTVTVTGPGTVSVIPATPADIEAYLGDAHYTRITGVPDWSTLSTKDVNPDGPADLPGIAQADLWPVVDTADGSTARIDVADFWKAENDPPQPYRAVLLVTDGEQAGASTVSISWPTHEVNEWAPATLVAGAIATAIGLVLLLAGFVMLRRAPREEADADGEIDDGGESDDGEESEPAVAEGGDAPDALDPAPETPAAVRADPAPEPDPESEPTPEAGEPAEAAPAGPAPAAPPARAHGRRRAIIDEPDPWTSDGDAHPWTASGESETRGASPDVESTESIETIEDGEEQR